MVDTNLAGSVSSCTSQAASDGHESPSKPVSKRKLEANRQNAQKSTGPNTEEGKAVSRWNSLKHGLASKILLQSNRVSETEKDGFNTLLLQILEHYDPVGPIEEMLVQKIVMEQWRIARGLNAEIEILSTQYSFNHPTLPQLGRYQTSANRNLDKAIENLHRLQSERKKRANSSADHSGEAERCGEADRGHQIGPH